jgi:hypothetical protein
LHTVLGSLAVLVFVLTALDHWTTWLCLRTEVEGWIVTEANPLADWLFASVGLTEGLATDSAITVAAVLFVLRTDLLPRHAKAAALALLCCTTGLAVINNLGAIRTMGISPWGLG